MARPDIPRLSPVFRASAGGRRLLIPAEEMARQVMELERLGCWALQQGLNEAGMVLDNPDDSLLNDKRMQRYFAISGACLGAINGRVNALRTLQEIDNGNIVGGDAEAYRKAGPGRQ